MIPSNSASPPRVLLADDNPHGLELLDAFLAGSEFETRTAANGEEVLRVLREWSPDVVLLDIMMPRLSGFEVCKSVRADEGLRGTGIIMVTALDQHSDIDRAVDAGTDDFLTKPINRDDLINRIRALLVARACSGDIARTLAYVQAVETAV